MPSLRIFVHIDENKDPVAAFTALSVPVRGDRIWIKTAAYQGHAVVQNVEHQFDLSRADVYGNQDVVLWCTSN